MIKSIAMLVANRQPARCLTYIKDNYWVKAAISLFFLLLFTLLPAQSTAAREVNSVAELQTALSDATEGEVITLSDSFVFGSATLAMPNVNVTIDGESKVWTNGSITISGSSDKTLTIENLKIDGTAMSSRLLTNKASEGTLILRDMEFYNSSRGAIDISTTTSASTKISRVRIYNNTAINTAPAIWMGEKSNIEINYSTIEDNTGTGGGYECGAISSKNYTGFLNINNTVFRNNKNKCVNTGIFGGGGGAMALHYFKGVLNIKESLFEGNQSNGEGVEVKSTFDGGAIYLFDGRDGAIFNVENTTFNNNIAYDDGGAMMIQGTGNPGLTTNITNCTFYNNKAYGLDGANYSGGAIQFFKNGGSSKMTNTILSSTFVNNQGGNEESTTEQRGGAIGLSGAGIFATATVTRSACLFIGNKVYNSEGVNLGSNYKDISNFTTAQIGTINVVNVDKGAEPAYTVDDILGKNFQFCENQSSIRAGVDNEIVKTYPIKPEGIADNTYAGTVAVPDEDQRQAARYKDQGAIEMSWVKYNANGGLFTLTPQTAYVGEVYYEATDENKVTDYYSINKIAEQGTVVDGNTTLSATLSGKTFKGWSTDQDATEPDPIYAPGKSLTYKRDNLTLYAIWGDGGYNLTYHANFDTDQTHTQLITTEQATVVTYSASTLPPRPNYFFVKWTTNADGTGTAYQSGDTFSITENTDLYAQWESNSTLKLQWSVSKTTPEILEFNDAANRSTTSVTVGTPVYVQIRPVDLEHIDFDTWSIEYAATPAEYHYPMDTPFAKTERYDFNKGEAHTLTGAYDYNVSRLILYKNGVEVAIYIYRNSCTHKVMIKDLPVVKDPVLQWSVSTVSHELLNFKDVDNQTTTSVKFGTPVFLQIRPTGSVGIDFERWEVEYSVTPAECYYGMAPTLKTDRHNFNGEEAHTEVGTYIYTVTKLTLYSMYGNQVVKTYDYKDSPYRHTIEIEEISTEPKIGVLQWSVSTTTNQLKDFRDVENLTETVVDKGTPVYVQIRPVDFSNLPYDRWEIEYTATPTDYHYPLEEAVLKSERYTFNKGEAHTLVGTYVYTIRKLTLYNGEEIITEVYYAEHDCTHTIIIRNSDLIGLGEIAPYCGMESEFRIPIGLTDPNNPLEYSVRFSDEALAAGFRDTEYKDVTVEYLTVPVSTTIARGTYSGSVYVRRKSNPDMVKIHPFEIEVLQTTTITKQPQSVKGCDGDNFILKVEAIGRELSYQWFFNNEAIPGATSDTYEAPLTPQNEGLYYVDVYGECGMESSDTVTIAGNDLRVLVKWNEFLYITNQENEFVRFQWYKDGELIDKNGTSIYYSIPEGLLGTYHIRAFRADDTYVDSCPITFDTLTRYPVTRVYPTMVNKNTPITVSLGDPDTFSISAVVEVYNLSGQLINRLVMKTWETKLPTNMASGSYIVKVTTEEGKTTTHKIIIK